MRQDQAPEESFISLLDTHRELDELFMAHQEALLGLDIADAHRHLRRFTAELLDHMRAEEELLLPIYRRAPQVPGGAAELFTAEHRKMREMLAQFEELVGGMARGDAGLKRRVIALLDDETTFKRVLAHHDLREANILYPTLDRVTESEERRSLLARSAADIQVE